MPMPTLHIGGGGGGGGGGVYAIYRILDPKRLYTDVFSAVARRNNTTIKCASKSDCCMVGSTCMHLYDICALVGHD